MSGGWRARGGWAVGALLLSQLSSVAAFARLPRARPDALARPAVGRASFLGMTGGTSPAEEEDGETDAEALKAQVERLRQQNAAMKAEMQAELDAKSGTDWDEAWQSFQVGSDDTGSLKEFEEVALVREEEGEGEEGEGGEEGGEEGELQPLESPALFNFDTPTVRRGYTAGLDTDPAAGEMRLLGLWTAKQQFQVACAAIAATLVFYLYVGLTGGITDGFDRFSEPIEDLQTTLNDPNYSPPLPPGAWTGVQ